MFFSKKEGRTDRGRQCSNATVVDKPAESGSAFGSGAACMFVRLCACACAVHRTPGYAYYALWVV
jgi:hypothetical protein